MNKHQNLKEQTKVFRSLDIIELRTEEGEGDYVIEGYAAPYGVSTNIGNWFTEEIREGAFGEDSMKDVVFLLNHDYSKIALARSRRNNANSTLQLSSDSKGLYFKAKLDVENNPQAAEIYSAVKRGDVNQMSVGMIVAGQEWEDLDKDLPHRIITKVSRLLDISAVNFPAYGEGTEISARATSDTLDSDKMALDNAKSQLLDNSDELELAKRKALFKIKKI